MYAVTLLKILDPQTKLNGDYLSVEIGIKHCVSEMIVEFDPSQLVRSVMNVPLLVNIVIL